MTSDACFIEKNN